MARQGDPKFESEWQVRLGDTVTFLPTPLRNWWGRPRLQQAWLGLSIYVIIVMVRCLAMLPAKQYSCRQSCLPSCCNCSGTSEIV
jgi:hypothetical protein